MALDSHYVIASDLMGVFLDKDTAEPLAYGYITFYSDSSPNTLKSVYQFSGNAASPTYTVLPNPIYLSANGSYQDALGNSIVPYYYPFTAGGDIDNYYITVHSATGVLQFTRSAWPNYVGADATETDEINFIPNGQFLSHNTNPVSSTLRGLTVFPIAQGGWKMQYSTGLGGTYSTTFTRVQSGAAWLNDFPRYLANFVGNGSEPIKELAIQWNDVNLFEGATTHTALGTQGYTLFLAGMCDAGTQDVGIYRVKYYGTGGSPNATEQDLIGTITLTSGGGYFNVPITFGSNLGKTVGTNNDDYLQLTFRPTTSTFNISITDVGLYIGTLSLSTFPPMTPAQMVSQSSAGFLPLPSTDGSDLYLPLVMTAEGFNYDRSIIGTIVGKPVSTAVNNELLMDGTSYSYASQSAIGIPYSRLGDYLIAGTPSISIADGGLGITAELTAGAANGICPMWGTGDDFVTLYNKTGSVGTVFLVQLNTVAAGIVADGAVGTGWTLAALAANTTYQWTVTGVPTAGQYWTFTEGSGGLVYNVWYSVDGAGTAPATPTGANIEVALVTGDTIATTITKTLIKVNQYKFLILDARGYFWRGLDSGTSVDISSASRTLSSITFGSTALTGANSGSLETAAFLQHTHADTFSAHIEYVNSNVAGGGTPTYRQDSAGGTALTIVPANANTGGGAETRPVNKTLNWFIKY